MSRGAVDLKSFIIKPTESEQQILLAETDDKILFRLLKRDDYERDFPAVLAGLTKGVSYSEDEFHKIYDSIFTKDSENYKIVVLEDKDTGMIIGSGSVIMEKKFIRDGGICGHVEDIVVSESYRG